MPFTRLTRLLMLGSLVLAVAGAVRPPALHAADPKLPPSTFVVDTKLTPSVKDAGDGKGRPLAAIAAADGTRADFIANELLVLNDSDQLVGELAARWKGTVVEKGDHQAAALAGVPALHRVRIDPTSADTSRLAERMALLAPGMRGDYRLSSDTGLRLLAVAAEEYTVRGLTVSPDFLASPDGFVDRRSIEEGGANACDEPYMTTGSVQNIGVCDAWRALALAGRISDADGGIADPAQRIGVVIVDAGFAASADTPAGSTVSPAGALGRRNPIPCSGGGSCPWHGANVTSAAVSLPNNGIGAAGVAGPVARALMVDRASTTLGEAIDLILRDLPAALRGGHRVITMSFSAEIPAVPAVLAAGVVNPITRAIAADNNLLFASAGNANKDVDRQDCVWDVCWEAAWHAPCEADAVICVGGLADDSNRREVTTATSGSNFGSRRSFPDSVHLFAPYVVNVAPDPDRPASRLVSGTSFSSPFAAGVAALVWAANPRLPAAEVARILFETANTGSPDGTVPRWVNAKAAVERALGATFPANFPPALTITFPATSGRAYWAGDYVSLRARTDDVEDGRGCCGTVRWRVERLDVPGILPPPSPGSASSYQFTTPGRYRVTASAGADSGGATAAPVSIEIRVVENPSLSIPPCVISRTC